MSKYIALKPVRFDRDYTIGEEIPARFVDPKSLKRLVESGRVAVINEDTDESKAASALQILVEFIETALSVSYDGEPPDVYGRADECMAGLASMMEAVLAVQEDDDDIDTTYNTAGNHPMTAGAGTNVPPPVGSFPCPECDRVFDTQAGLNSHMRTHR